MMKKQSWLAGIVIIVSSLVFITLKVDCNITQQDISKLKMKKKIISNKIKVLKMEENKLLSKSRIEMIAIKELRMHSPSPESLIVYIK